MLFRSTNTLRLLQLPATIQRHLQDGTLRMGHARALLGTPDRAFQEELARRAVEEDLSVRAVEEAVRIREAGSAAPAPDQAGAGKTASPTQAASGLRPPGLMELEELLGDYLNTRVKIAMGPKLGKVQIDFADLGDLERIYRLMTQGVTGS